MTVIRLHDGDRFVTGIAREGRTKLHLTSIDDAGVRRQTFDRDWIKAATLVSFRGKPYPVARAVKHLRRVGRERGITEAAKRELAIASQDPT